MRRTIRAGILLLVLAALAAPGSAVGQARGPATLWDAYPLDQPATTPEPAPAAPPAAEVPTPAPAAAPGESDEGVVLTWAVIAAGFAAVVVGGGIAIFAVARLRRRRETATHRWPGPAHEESAAAAAPVAAPVGVSAPSGPAGVPEPVAREAMPAPAASPAAVARAEASPAATPPEPSPVVATTAEADAEAVARADDLELAELAAEYLWTVATGSRRPVVDLAARRFERVGRTREMLGRARARGILAGAGRGRPGGALTEKGRRLLEEGARSTTAPAWREGVLPPVVANPETAPPGPPRLRLAEDGEGPEPSGSSPGDGVMLAEADPPGRAFTVLEGGARHLP